MDKVKFRVLICISAAKEPRDYIVGLGHSSEALRQTFLSVVLWERNVNIHMLLVSSISKNAHTQQKVEAVCFFSL